MKVERIDHIHVYVKNLETAVKSFSDLLGSRFVGPTQHPVCRVAFDNLGFELVEPTPEHPMAKALEERGEGAHCIGVKVPNIDEAVAELEAKGIKILFRGIRGRIDVEVAHTDPKALHGVCIELVQYQDTQGALWANLNKVRDLPWM